MSTEGRDVMSDATAGFLLESRGIQRELDAFVVAACFDRAGTTVAFALGDGTLRLVALADRETWQTAAAHDGAILCLAADATPTGFVTGGDDGRFRRIGGRHRRLRLEMGRACRQPSRRQGQGPARLRRRQGDPSVRPDAAKKLKELPHPSSVTGLTFDARGKRVAASHYNGATLWFVNAKEDNPRKLEWKGSHTGIAIHPDGDAVVTAMQENALHGWRLSDGQHMRMSGYPAKTEALSFTRNGKWLATSGADAMVLWPFFGGGPMGKAPIELAGGDGITCTRVAAHPQQEMVAGGFADGLVVLADVNSSRILPVAPPGRGPVSALAWSPDGSQLAFGTEQGFAAIVDLAQR